MDINRITITQEDKYKTYVYPYYTSLEPIGSIVILHGMAEHHERYLPFKDYLNAQGYDVFLYDHRGHGRDKKFEDLGHFADKDGYKLVIEDAISVLLYVKRANRADKLILFGHSMGSIIARNVIQRFDDIDACIICGTAYMAPNTAAAGLLLAKTVKLIKGAHTYSPFLANLTTGYKDFAKISNRTAFDWLTRDNNIVGQYINDSFCGYVCTTAFYCDLIKLTELAAVPNLIRRTRSDLPILFISGSNDPVGSYGVGVSKLFSLYQKYGFANSDCTIYEECRHELLNELNRETIMQDITGWIDRVLFNGSDADADDSSDDDSNADS